MRRSIINEEVQVKDTQGIPEDYPERAKARAKQRLGISGQGPHSAHQYGMELMSNLQQSQRLSRGYERELEALATKVITDLYKPILDFYKIKLDIKFSTGPDIRRMIDAGFARTSHSKTGKDVVPVIRARGADFTMLIHEAVKGLWFVMSQSASPPGELGKVIKKTFTLREEPEEFMYGPEIAADLRDFILENPHADNYPNLREFVWMHMVDPQKMPTEEFLELMKGILNKTKAAREKVDKIIEKVVSDEEKLKKYEKEYAKYLRELEEWERKYGNLPAAPPKAQAPPDYSKMDHDELQRHLDIALDKKDYELAAKIAEHM